MCGIWTLIEKTKQSKEDIGKYIADFYNIKHRGPDNSHLMTFDNTMIGFHRLAIVDTSLNSNQPFIFKNGMETIIFVCNGEIYNYMELDKMYDLDIHGSDCMVIPKLYIKLGLTKWYELFNHTIKGEYAFIMLVFNNMNRLEQYMVGRDTVGVRPLYHTKYNNTLDLYCSEIKGMNSTMESIEEFPPGTIQTTRFNSFEYKMTEYKFDNIYNKYIYQPSNITTICKTREKIMLENVRTSVISSIKRRLCADRPIAFLLSGGVDSSLIASISSKILGQRIKTFCCGIKGSTDMKYAKMVADHINSIHTEVYFTEEEGLEAIDDVVYTTETWDTTTIRASVGQYLVSKYISQNTDCKVVLVGEGPDEVCSSYLFNYYAPNANDMHKTAEEYVKKIHQYDGRRADRCIARWGMEARVPFLDPEFISTYWSIDANMRLPTNVIEKYMLRKAFDRDNLLPNEVLWRKKEAFSDGVSSKERSWYQIIQEYTNKKMAINSSAMDMRQSDLHNDKDTTSETVYYRLLFWKYFGVKRDNIISHYWQPKWDKDGNIIEKYVDPSARTLEVY